MDHKPPANSRKLFAADLLQTASKLAEMAATLIEQESGAVPIGDAWLDEKQMSAEYGLGRCSADSRGIPKARIGRSYKWRRSDIETAIETEPPKPRTRKCKPSDGEDAFEALLASGSVVPTRAK